MTPYTSMALEMAVGATQRMVYNWGAHGLLKFDQVGRFYTRMYSHADLIRAAVIRRSPAGRLTMRTRKMLSQFEELLSRWKHPLTEMQILYIGPTALAFQGECHHYMDEEEYIHIDAGLLISKATDIQANFFRAGEL